MPNRRVAGVGVGVDSAMRIRGVLSASRGCTSAQNKPHSAITTAQLASASLGAHTTAMSVTAKLSSSPAKTCPGCGPYQRAMQSPPAKQRAAKSADAVSVLTRGSALTVSPGAVFDSISGSGGLAVAAMIELKAIQALPAHRPIWFCAAFRITSDSGILAVPNRQPNKNHACRQTQVILRPRRFPFPVWLGG